MYVVFITGTAGSGKSNLTSSLLSYLRNEDQKAIALNLDPGASTLPYQPDIDVREHVKIEDVMKDHNLGPNGALIMATDMIADEIDRLWNDATNLESDIILVDTPGQIELFAFRKSGPFIVRSLGKMPKIILHLFDAVFSSNPFNFVSNMLFSAAVYTSFLLPQVNILSKCDLLSDEDLERLLSWGEDVSQLEYDLNKWHDDTRRLLGRDILLSIHNLGLNLLLIPTSAKTNMGLENLEIVLERILSGGEDFSF